MFRTVFSIFAAAALVFAASCGGKTGDKGAKTDKAPSSKKDGQQKAGEPESKAEPVTSEGAETPEKAFDAVKAALEGKGSNYSKVITFIAPDERVAVAVMVHMLADEIASLGEGDKAAEEYAALVSKHKVITRPEGLEDHQIAEAFDSFPKLIALGKRMTKGVDVPAFIKDTEAFINKAPDDSRPRDKVSGLQDLKIESDRATATFKSGEEELPVIFKKTRGRWFVSMETLVN